MKKKKARRGSTSARGSPTSPSVAARQPASLLSVSLHSDAPTTHGVPPRHLVSSVVVLSQTC